MAWPLVVVGICMGIAMILVQVRSPMLFGVGMYLPLETTFAIFFGGMIRWLTDTVRDRGTFNDAQKARVENVGVLIASGLIAGEALMGLVSAGFTLSDHPLAKCSRSSRPPHWIHGLVVLALLAFVMVRWPLAKAGDPNEPAPPTAMM